MSPRPLGRTPAVLRYRPAARLLARARRATRSGERGDVPGWVLVTVMTAGLVSALWLVADDQLGALFSRALDSVTGP